MCIIHFSTDSIFSAQAPTGQTLYFTICDNCAVVVPQSTQFPYYSEAPAVPSPCLGRCGSIILPLCCNFAHPCGNFAAEINLHLTPMFCRSEQAESKMQP